MNTTADYLIIGGGVMGASIAYHLAKQGNARVLLLERQALGNGTTGRSGAIIRQHYSNDFTIRMAKESLQVFANFDEMVGGECGFVPTGMLVLSDKQGSDALRANVALQQAQGVATKLIEPVEVSNVAPGYSGDGAALVCYEEDAGVADPMATTHCFARRARDYGATIIERTTVLRILIEGERVTGVETAQGTFSAPTVVLAANVWSTALAREIGISLPITATRHPMLALRRPDDFGGRQGMHAVCLDVMRGIYLRPDLGGITLIGATGDILDGSDPDHYAQGLSEEEISYFREKGRECLPPLARAVPRGGWAGIYDDTPDYHPILGSLPQYSGLYCAVGFSGHGFKLSPTVGRWIADLVTTGKAADDMKHFAYERFAEATGEIKPRYSSGVLG
jgi:glycine/D-amino acid oxidase-like deaminating enzyme